MERSETTKALIVALQNQRMYLASVMHLLPQFVKDSAQNEIKSIDNTFTELLIKEVEKPAIKIGSIKGSVEENERFSEINIGKEEACLLLTIISDLFIMDIMRSPFSDLYNGEILRSKSKTEMSDFLASALPSLYDIFENTFNFDEIGNEYLDSIIKEG